MKLFKQDVPKSAYGLIKTLSFSLPLFLCFSNPFIPPKAWLVSIHQGKENLSYQKEEQKDCRGRNSDSAPNLGSVRGEILVMEKQQSQIYTENDVEKIIIEGQSAKQSSSSTESPASESSSSSPSQEFSFSVSLYSSYSNTNPFSTHNSATSPNSLAPDFSPADDIFFHGHLLPLHFLSHLPVSPRSSTNSMDSFTLPITDSTQAETPINEDLNMAMENNGRTKEEEGRSKSKSFSLFRLRGRKGCEERDKEEAEKQSKKQRFHFVHVLKKYLRMMQPLIRGRKHRIGVQGQSYSYSENLSFRDKSELRGRGGGEYSAPASIRTSPNSSGLLLPTMALPSANDSTMEELQAAIQAAIAHCKSSFATEEKLKS